MSIKIVVVSDTHGNTDMLEKVIGDCSPFDIIIHCGDGVRDISSAEIPALSTVIKVSGNTDIYSCYDDDLLTETIYGKTVMVTHGHRFDVKSGLKMLIDEAHHQNAGIVIFGHTHEQLLRKGTPYLFNPGNLSSGCYGIIYAHNEKEWVFEHRKIKRG